MSRKGLALASTTRGRLRQCRGLLLGGVLLAVAQAAQLLPVRGEVTRFESATGLQEQCIALDRFPGARYSEQDLRTEAGFCQLDFAELALCPKLWSTSPATIVYDIGRGASTAAIAQFETALCRHSHRARRTAKGEPAVFKMSVNGPDTSATYAPSSWIYYHLSRYLQTRVVVPVAVYRDTDRQQHHRRVVVPALDYVAGRHELRLLAAGWRFLDSLETGAGTARHDLFSADGKRVYGVLVNGRGERYGPLINGSRQSGWGDGQSYDFQQTPAFLALRSDGSLPEAIAAGLRQARHDPAMAAALSPEPGRLQMALWMQEIAEIALLDFILGQQDRIGNIDYVEEWTWLENGALQSLSAEGGAPPLVSGAAPLRIKRSAINDNDAGVKTAYRNYARRTHMLRGLRHYPPALYARLELLVAGLRPGGEARVWLEQSAGLTDRESEAIARRALEAFAQLSADCRAGSLRLDLVPASALGATPVADKKIDCGDAP